MTHILSVFILSIILISSCTTLAPRDGKDAKPLQDSNNKEDDQNVVYASVIKSMYINKETDIVVIYSQTLPIDAIISDWDKTSNYLKYNLPLVPEETLKNFREINRQPYIFNLTLNLPVKYVFINSEESNSVLNNGGWLQFYEKYPKSQGILSFSRVSFSYDKKQALVYVQNQRSYNIGNSFFLRLTNEGDGWNIKDKYQWSVS